MIVVAGSARVRPEKRVEAMELAKRMTEQTRQEAGCRSSGYYVSVESPETFFLFQVWESEEALNEHYRQEHVRQFQEKLPEMLAGETAVHFLNRYDVESVMPL
ncbi:MAG: putative quinol monooxygenase [Armatimonadaceae bacterium]